jgi:orotidine-5'-phosphate decarboxylase
MKTAPQMIVALDCDAEDEAKRLIDVLYPTVRMFKIGSQLFTGHGPEAVAWVKEKGAGVFLDLKYHDIPHTVARAVRQACRIGVAMLTLHIAGGAEMIRQSRVAVGEAAAAAQVRPPLLIGVTVLTSSAGHAGEVVALAREGVAAGLDGIVCAVSEARAVKQVLGESVVVVTPGIRPAGGCVHDQKRVATAAEAARAGSDFIVVGRPVVEAADPLHAARALLSEMA